MYRNTINSRGKPGSKKRRGVGEMKRNLIRSERTQRERPEVIYIGKNYTER